MNTFNIIFQHYDYIYVVFAIMDATTHYVWVLVSLAITYLLILCKSKQPMCSILCIKQCGKPTSHDLCYKMRNMPTPITVPNQDNSNSHYGYQIMAAARSVRVETCCFLLIYQLTIE